MFVLGCFLFIHFIIVRCVLNPLAARDISFEDFRFSKIVTGLDTQGFHRTKTRTECAWLCSTTPECLSFNFYESRNCELNSGASFTPGAVFQTSHSCSYSGVLKSAALTCQEKGIVLENPDENQQMFCNFEQKMQNIDSASVTARDWKKLRSRDCATAVGDTDFECEEGDEAILLWYKLVSAQQNIDDAKENCANMGGTLFYDVDGTTAQLQQLAIKLGGNFWTGIWTDDHVTWHSPDGNVIPDNLLTWLPPNEPNGASWGEKFVGAGGAGLLDLVPHAKLKSICDML